nr:hypothetical protein [Mucilaginibacter sp. L294]
MKNNTTVMESITTKGYGASGSLIGGKTLEPMDFGHINRLSQQHSSF